MKRGRRVLSGARECQRIARGTTDHEDLALEPRQVLAVVYADRCCSAEQLARAEELMRTDPEFREEVRVQQQAADSASTSNVFQPSAHDVEQVLRRVLKNPRPFRTTPPGSGVFWLALGLAVCGS